MKCLETLETVYIRSLNKKTINIFSYLDKKPKIKLPV